MQVMVVVVGGGGGGGGGACRDLDLAVAVEQDVGGLQVVVDDAVAGPVDVGQPRRHLRRYDPRLLLRR